MDEKLVTVKFDGQAHQVDINTFTGVLLSYARVLQEAAKETNLVDPVSVYIRANEPGSLDVVVSVVSQGLSGMLTFLSSHKDGLEAVVVLAAGLYGLKQKLAGKKEIKESTEINDSEILLIADNEKVIVNKDVYNFYVNSPAASEAVNNSFCVLEENPSITGFEIKDKEKTLFRAEQDEFTFIAQSPLREESSSRHIEESARLIVVKPCLTQSNTRKWEFIHNGNRMSATISDQNFLDNISKYKFGQGTTMQVVLDILQEYNEDFKTYINKSYSIKTVLEVTDLDDTPPLF